MKALFTVLIVVALMLPSSGRVDEKDDFMVGVGTIAQKCGTWIENRESQLLTAVQIGSAQGFLSGMNYALYIAGQDRVAVIPDYPTILAYMDNYCRKNPLNSVYKGLLDFYYYELPKKVP